MTQKGRITFPTIVFSAIIVLMTWSLIEGWFPFTRRKWLFLTLGMGYALLLKNSFYRSKRFIWLLVYMVVIVLNMLFDDKYFHDIGTVGYEFFVLGFPAVVTVYFQSVQNRKSMGFLLFSFLFVLTITAVASFLIDTFLLPNAIRMMTRYSITLKDMSVVYNYYRMGLSTYAFPHALPVLIPPVIMGLRNKDLSKKIRLLCWIALGGLIVLIYLSGIMTALLLSVAGLAMALMTKVGDMSRNIRRFVVIGILILPFLNPSFMGSVLHEAKMTVGEESYYYNKLESFENSVTGEGEEEDGDWNERKDLYSRSLDDLSENFIAGTNNKVGGHSAFLDRFALLGLIGFIPFSVFFFLQLRFASMLISQKYLIYYYEGTALGLIMLALKSSFVPETLIVLFTILPVSVYYLSYEKSSL